MKQVTLVRVDDWEALYVDGEVQLQNHSIDANQVLDILAEHMLINHESFWVDGDWVESQGWMPENLEDIPDDAKVD